MNYTTQKKFRIAYYIICVYTILNSHSCSGREENSIKLSKHYQWVNKKHLQTTRNASILMKVEILVIKILF